MPTACEPDELGKFYFDGQDNLPKEKRKGFECSAPTRRLMRKFWEQYDELVICQDKQARMDVSERSAYRVLYDQSFEIMIKMILLGAKSPIGYETMPADGKLTGDWIEDNLQEPEIRALALGWYESFQMNATERKNLQSPSQSDAASSAVDASAASVSNSPATTDTPGSVA